MPRRPYGSPRTGRDHRTLVPAALCAILGVSIARGQAPLDAPAEAVLTEARELVEGMIENPRGPYSRIRWFCNDGTVQPPVAYACRDRGGGRQHGEYSAERQRLAELGWSVGTVFAALEFEELYDAEHRQQRLRELALERYLTDTADGWVLHRARSYRGRVQVEAEEAAGRALLLTLLGDADWIRSNYLLARESVRVIPHTGGSEDRTREVRRGAVDVAERDGSFEPLRVEVHTAPTIATATRIRDWAEGKPADTAQLAHELASGLDELYGAGGRRARLAEQRRVLAAQPATAALAERLLVEGLAPVDRVEMLAGFLREARERIDSTERPGTRLLLFETINEVEAELILSADQALGNPDATRGELLGIAGSLSDAVFGAGLLTSGEHTVLQSAWRGVEGTHALSLQAYAEVIAYLRRVPQWAAGSVRYAFAEPLIRYTALDRRAAVFVDDLLRSSSLAPLAEVTRRLARDLGELTGITQSIFGETAVGAFGLNPGLAVGPLVVPRASDTTAATYRRTDIVLLPETIAELTPVAGILTLGEGNPLSHVQLLARNFGIPNISISPTALPQIESREGDAVLAAVASDGSFVLADAVDLDAEVAALLGSQDSGARLTVRTPDLSMRRVLRLDELNAGLSGRWVGPKAANLGELARMFPDHVAPAVAVPFGVFATHLNAGTPSLRERLTSAYRDGRSGASGEAALLDDLASIRRDITALELSTEYRDALTVSMADLFGEPGSYGVFIRSDTNVEDLPQFTGAGLSETLPNVVSPEQQLSGISRVWASVLSPRAIAWRSNLMTNPEEVYASVLLMKSVPAEKSGVLVTANLAGREPGLTVSTAWGVGGAVAGEAAETLVLKADGGELLVSEAKVAYQRGLAPAGGIRWQPAPDGPVLMDTEKTMLRELAREVTEKYEPVLDEDGRPRPWDIEFGFVSGGLALFQIRPLVERGPRLANRVVSAMAARRLPSMSTEVDLSKRPALEIPR